MPMESKHFLVTAFTSPIEAALLAVALDSHRVEVLFPCWFGGLEVTPRQVYLARTEGDETVLETYDEQGLIWMRRMPNCVDPHSICVTNEWIAVNSTGTNEIIFLDSDGAEFRRWSPDDMAEEDSWHLNSLVFSSGRLYATCFGAFSRFRGYADNMDRSGMLLDVAESRPVLSGLTTPHDPRREGDHWFVNESKKRHTVCVRADGTREVVAEVEDFARGLALTKDWYIVGSSAHRRKVESGAKAKVTLVDRIIHTSADAIPIPYREIGHIYPIGETLLNALRKETNLPRRPPAVEQSPIPEKDRAGGLTVVGIETDGNARSVQLRITVCVRNEGRAIWSSARRYPVNVAYSLVTDDGDVAWRDGVRTRLPITILPGKSVTFPLTVDLTPVPEHCRMARLRITLVEEDVAWWEATPRWEPADLSLASVVTTAGHASAKIHRADEVRQD